MGARVEDLATLLTSQTGWVPVVAQRLPPLSKVDRAAALLTRPHPGTALRVTSQAGLWSPGHLQGEAWLSQIYRESEDDTDHRARNNGKTREKGDSECGDEVVE